MDWLNWLVLFAAVVGSFRAFLYLRSLSWGSLLFKETINEKLPIEITKNFEMKGHKSARFIVRTPHISLLSFKGRMVLQNSKGEILGKLLINEEKDGASKVPVRVIAVRPRRATWISADYADVPNIDQNDTLVTVNLNLDWRKKASIGMRSDKSILLEIDVRVAEK